MILRCWKIFFGISFIFTKLNGMINYLEIICHFYPDDTPLRKLLITHSRQVADKAMAILSECNLKLDDSLVVAGAMVHDIGIVKCYAPTIYCEGSSPYIAHGIIGATMLRELSPELEVYARFCERHTGSGLTKQDIISQNLSLPPQNYLPETPEEKLICLADKFFSKSDSFQEKKLDKIRFSMAKFGKASLERFDNLCRYFAIDPV